MKPVVLCIINSNNAELTFLNKDYKKTILKKSTKDDVNNNIKNLRKLANIAAYTLKEKSINELLERFNSEIDTHDGAIINLVSKDIDNVNQYVLEIIAKVESLQGKVILMVNEENKQTACYIKTNKKLRKGHLVDTTPTMLEMMNIKKTKDILGSSLIKTKDKADIFIIISGIVLFSLVLIYGIRFVHYYKIEHTGVMADNTLVNKIITKNKVVNNNGLVINGDKYIFKGKVKNNYVLYSGYLFRIVGINKDKTIKLVTDDITTSLVWSYDKGYEESYIKQYLEEKFYKTLVDPKNYLATEEWCIDQVNKKYDICKDKLKAKVGLLTYNDYVLANSNNSYLNINKYWWTMNSAKDNKVWYVFSEGGINNDSYDDNTYYSFGVRPSINLKANVNYVSGDGTKNDPYVIDSNSDLTVGSYVSYSNYTWKVISKSDTLKLVMADCLKENDECIEYNFSRSTNDYDASKYYSLANYLNNSFIYNLDTTHLVKGTWYTGEYGASSNYDYNNIYTDSTEAKVGILDIVENNKINTFTLNKTGKLLYSLNENGSLSEVDVTEKLNVYPAINLDLEYQVIGGTGTLEDPFIIE